MTDAQGSTRDDASGGRRAWLRWLALGVVAASGVAFGYGIGYTLSQGGFGYLGAVLVGSVLLALVLGSLAVAGIAAALPNGRGHRVVRPAVTAAGVLVLGAVLGAVSVPLLGLGYRLPVTHESSGTMTLGLEVDGFTPRPGAAATCASGQDVETVGAISGLDLGELHQGTMRGSFNVAGDTGPSEGGEVQVELFVDGADVVGMAPFWHGAATFLQVEADGRAGVVGFVDLQIQSAPDGKQTTVSSTWPKTLTGDVEWRCTPWP